MFVVTLISLCSVLWASPIRWFVKNRVCINGTCRLSYTGINGDFPRNVLGVTKYSPFEKYLPPSRGVYMIVSRTGVVQYVGSSNDIHKRLLTHGRSGVLQQGDIVEAVIFSHDARQQEIFNYERAKITALNPPKNKHPGTPGRTWNSEHIHKLSKFYAFNKKHLTADGDEVLERFLRGDKIPPKDYKVIRAFSRITKYFR